MLRVETIDRVFRAGPTCLDVFYASSGRFCGNNRRGPGYNQKQIFPNAPVNAAAAMIPAKKKLIVRNNFSFQIFRLNLLDCEWRKPIGKKTTQGR